MASRTATLVKGHHQPIARGLRMRYQISEEPAQKPPAETTPTVVGDSNDQKAEQEDEIDFEETGDDGALHQWGFHCLDESAEQEENVSSLPAEAHQKTACRTTGSDILIDTAAEEDHAYDFLDQWAMSLENQQKKDDNHALEEVAEKATSTAISLSGPSDLLIDTSEPHDVYDRLDEWANGLEQATIRASITDRTSKSVDNKKCEKLIDIDAASPIVNGHLDMFAQQSNNIHEPVTPAEEHSPNMEPDEPTKTTLSTLPAPAPCANCVFNNANGDVAPKTTSTEAPADKRFLPAEPIKTTKGTLAAPKDSSNDVFYDDDDDRGAASSPKNKTTTQPTRAALAKSCAAYCISLARPISITSMPNRYRSSPAMKLKTPGDFMNYRTRGLIRF